MKNPNIGYRVVLAAFSIALILSSPDLPDRMLGVSAQGSDCEVTIFRPSNGDTVEATGTVTGSATVRVNTHLWLLVRPAQLEHWRPQGGGEAQVANGQWSVQAQYGANGEQREFEVRAIFVNDDVNSQLNAWVATSESQGEYSSIDLPPTVDGCGTSTAHVSVGIP